MIKYENFIIISLKSCFLELSENFLRTKKRVRISHGKRAISVRSLKICCIYVLRLNLTYYGIIAGGFERHTGAPEKP